MSGKKRWQPMERTVLLISIWYSKLARADINAENLSILEECILEDSVGFRPSEPDDHGKIPYSDQDHTKREALLDFVLAVSRILSDKELYHLTSVVLTLQYQEMKSGGSSAINTFLRNNELAKYLIMVEMGKLCNPKKRALPKTTQAHLSTMVNDYSDISLTNLVNTIFIQGFNQSKISYYGLKHIHIPKTVSIEQIASIRDQDWHIDDKINDRHPSQPSWLNHPQINRNALTNFSAFNPKKKKSVSTQPATPLPKLLKGAMT